MRPFYTQQRFLDQLLNRLPNIYKNVDEENKSKVSTSFHKNNQDINTFTKALVLITMVSFLF